MLLAAQGGLLAVRVVREEGLVDGLPQLAAVLREGHVLLLVDGLQLRVEAPYHAVAEAVGLDAGPVVDLVGGDVLGIDGLVGGGPGIGAVGADHGHQLVIFVGDGEFGGLVAHRVDPVVDGLAFRLVRGSAVLLEQLLDLVEHRLLRGIVHGTELLRALEHQVLEIVREARSLGGVVLAAHLHGHVGLDTGLLLVHGHKDFHSVVKGVDLGLERVAFDGFAALAGGCGKHRQDDGRSSKDSLHHNKCYIN